MTDTATQHKLSSAFNENFEAGFPPLITPRDNDIPAFRMVYLPGGTFMMGDDNSKYDEEKPAHEVKLSGFYMAEFQVTQKLYQAITGNNPSNFQNSKKPVEQVTWFDAVNFCNTLGAKLGLQPCYKKVSDNDYQWDKTAKGLRLPTEAEWEFACRGDNSAPLTGRPEGGHKYAGSNNLDNIGWYDENSHGRSKKAGLKFPNAAGLYDMSGNLFEWCQDWFDEKYYQKCKDRGIVKNPSGPETGKSRVLRGGSWGYDAFYGRSAYRFNDLPGNIWFNFSFRLVLGL